MRTFSVVTGLALLLLAGCGTAADEGPGAGGSSGSSATSDAASTPAGGTDAASTPCDLFSVDTVDAVTSALADAGYELDLTGEAPPGPTVSLAPGQETFVACSFGGVVNAGVRGFDDGRSLLAVTTGSALRAPEPEPLDGLGDVAYTTLNSYDGIRVTAQVGDDLVLVDSLLRDDADPVVPADLLVQVARELAEGVGAADVPLAELPETCPSATDPVVAEEIGEVRLARGAASGTGVTCSYVSDEAYVRLASRSVDPALMAMWLADAGEPVTVDGREVYVDDEQATLVVSESCGIAATRAPLGWTTVGSTDDEQEAAALVDLVVAAQERIDCH
ncbi:hypothetical protein RDV89_09965 [Nocardioides zeae]|uniref:DUF3558 domain-containing protein n=1 Tax=Nocardioides imazamoxiresistens TaxID=3231893 RepID=A0ABU3PVZ0_9ACTN|nr:hypothetical protein [Nocardioides zeae]MDT9593393.1 hypothetical protein [Nocardioides zeae]